MDKNAVLVIVNDFKEVLESKSIKIKRIVLYGSYASGKYREGSDIDLVVISNDFKDKSYWERKDSMIVDFAQDGEVVFAA